MGLFSSVCCETCDESLPFFYTTQAKMISVALQQGWEIGDEGESYCPKCKVLHNELKATKENLQKT